MKLTKGEVFEIGIVVLFGLAIGLLKLKGSPVGSIMGHSALEFGVNIFKVLPCAFVLIGLFEVWVKAETVEKHFGVKSGLRGNFWGIVLASTTVGGLYVAFPVAMALLHKGARLSVVFTYLGAAALVRIPMTIFEASFLGIKFTLVRLLISLPLVILSAELLSKVLKNQILPPNG